MVEATAEKPKMIYRRLGGTGLKVSVLGFGNYGGSVMTRESYETTRDCIKACYDAGVNFFDTAEIYGMGKAEEQMGEAFKELGLRRESIVVTTKLFMAGGGVNDKGMGRKHMMEGMQNSLKRLQLDYVDLIYSHRPDAEVPLMETCRAMHDIIENGWAFYWGTSEWSAQRITQAIGICDKYGWHRPIVEQPEYSMLKRERFEAEYSHLFAETGYGTTIWSPLVGGILSGKYNDGSCPEGTRFSDDQNGKTFTKYLGEGAKEKTVVMLKQLAEVAASLGVSQAALAIAWCIANKDCTVALMGFSRVGQVEPNLLALKALEQWSPELEAKLEKILDNTPPAEVYWRTFGAQPGRRATQVYKP